MRLASSRPALWFILIAVVAVLAAYYVASVATFDDFRAFYCAGSVARAGADPYMAEPLHRCELAAMPAALRAQWVHVAIPAPLPPYALAIFAFISLLPFGVAAYLWTFASIAACAVIVLTLKDLTRLSAAAILVAIALPVFGASIMLGQTVPIVGAAVCLCAWFLSRDARTGTAIAAALALLDPRIGLAVCAALAVWVPAVRVRLILMLCAVVAASMVLGVHTGSEYFTTVLPAHGLSEAASFEQYSLTAIVYALGAPLAAASVAGSISFVVMVCAGIALARIASLKFEQPAFIVLVPAAFAVIGGPFIHLTQIAAVIPAVLLLYSVCRRYRQILLSALVLLALPWPMAKSATFIYLAPVLTFALIWWIEQRKDAVAGFAFAVVVAVAAFTLHQGYLAEPQSVHVAGAQQPAEPKIPARLAEASWSHLMWTTESNDDALSWAKRIPTWCGLVLLVVSAMGASTGSAALRLRPAHLR